MGVEAPSVGSYASPARAGPAGAHAIPLRDLSFGRELGVGAFGRVVEGVWRRIPVAVKQLRSERVSLQAVDEFVTEIVSNTRLSNNNNVVRVFGYTIDGDTYGIVMERMKTSMFSQFIEATATGPAPPVPFFATKLDVLTRLAEGLEELHQAGVIHRDLKSQNVLLDDSGHPKIADFGLSFSREAVPGIDDEPPGAAASLGGRRNCGTPTHMAPELFVDYIPAPETTIDVYAFGVLMWELLAQRPVLPELVRATPQLRSFVVGGGRPRIGGSIRADVPPGIIELMVACWAANPLLRPSMTAVRSTLRSYRGGECSNREQCLACHLIFTEAVPIPFLPSCASSRVRSSASAPRAILPALHFTDSLEGAHSPARASAPPPLRPWVALNSRPPAALTPPGSAAVGLGPEPPLILEERMETESSRTSQVCEGLFTQSCCKPSHRAHASPATCRQLKVCPCVLHHSKTLPFYSPYTLPSLRSMARSPQLSMRASPKQWLLCLCRRLDTCPSLLLHLKLPLLHRLPMKLSRQKSAR